LRGSLLGTFAQISLEFVSVLPSDVAIWALCQSCAKSLSNLRMVACVFDTAVNVRAHKCRALAW